MSDARVAAAGVFSTQAVSAPVVAQAAPEAVWPPRAAVRAGMWLAIAAITMLFLAFTSALIVRQGLDELWQPIRMPRLLTANTIVLMLSSVLLELARRRRNPKPWLVATLSAGILFVAGQLTAWRQLADAGLLFSTSAHASFFYTLTAVHGLHLAGGLMALGWLTLFRGARARWLEPAALYWHFMGALWLYLMYVLFGIR